MIPLLNTKKRKKKALNPLQQKILKMLKTQIKKDDSYLTFPQIQAKVNTREMVYSENQIRYSLQRLRDLGLASVYDRQWFYDEVEQ